MQMRDHAVETVTPTAAVAAFVSGFSFSHMEPHERAAVRRQTLDTIGVAISGSQSAVVARMERALEPGPAAAVVPGLARAMEPMTAALLFGTAAHSLEFDDGHRGGSVHPGCVVVPAVLSYAAGRKLSGAELMRAIAIGYQVVVGLAEELNPRARPRGFHNTPVAGVMGATAAVAALMRLKPRQVEDALGIAASAAGGIFAFLLGGGDIKRIHAGLAARDGILAATLAQAGVTGPSAVIEAEDGFLHAFAGGPPSEAFAEGFRLPRPEGGLKIAQSYIKPYSCCAHLHPAIDAVLDLQREEGFAAQEVDAIQSGTYAIAAHHADAGWGSMGEAQLSYPFSVASAALRGPNVPEHYADAALADPATTALAHRIAVSVDPQAQAVYPNARSASVSVTLKDGRRFSKTVTEPRGSPSKPVSDADLSSKFRALAEPVVGAGGAERIESLVGRLEQLEDAGLLTDALSPRTPRVRA